MRFTCGTFLVFFLFSRFAFSVDFPTVPQNSDGAAIAPDLNFTEFPKPKSETDLDFVAFPMPSGAETGENALEFTDFPKPKNGLLQATVFPKTVKDLSFQARMDLLTEGFAPYQIEYDENGVCVSGCAFPGITIAEDMAAVEEANEEIADLIEEEEKGKKEERRHATDWCNNGLSSKLPLRYPVEMTKLKYKITSDFGFRTRSANGARFHPAVDIACPSGTPVYATADGIVKYVRTQNDPGGAGHWIGIEHDNGLLTQYLHLSKFLVSEGQRVRACDKIALSGNSGTSIEGKSYGPHLDYRIKFDSAKNSYVDILCPCKASTKSGQGQTSNTDMSCAHSLFNAKYKFKQGAKLSNWRVEHGHCMKNTDSLLPDETRGESTDSIKQTIGTIEK